MKLPEPVALLVPSAGTGLTRKEKEAGSSWRWLSRRTLPPCRKPAGKPALLDPASSSLHPHQVLTGHRGHENSLGSKVAHANLVAQSAGLETDRRNLQPHPGTLLHQQHTVAASGHRRFRPRLAELALS